MPALGCHYIVDYYGCVELDVERWRAAVHEAVDAMGTTLVELSVHPFTPHGTTGVAILAESHLAFHTWPERDYVAVDVFTCGEQVRPEAGLEVLQRYLQPRQTNVQRVDRGRTVPTTRAAAR